MLQIKLIDNIIIIVKRNLTKKYLRNKKGDIVDLSRTDDHFKAFVKSFKADLF